MDRENPAEDLNAPAGKPADLPGVITNVTERRKELLERLAADPDDAGYVPPGKASEPDSRNRQAYEEAMESREAVENENGYP